MKKILIVIAVVIAGLIAYNYVTSGEFSVVPSFTLSEDEKELKALENRFNAAVKQYSQAGRTAGLSGMDTTADAEAARLSVQQISKELKSLQKRLSSDSLIRRAERLAADVREFAEKLR
jgi:hypothetical protein